MRKQILVAAASALAVPAFAFTAPASAAPQAKTDTISPANAACGRAGNTSASTRTNDAASPNAANQRSGSSTSCAATGVLQPTDDATYFCFTVGSDGTWTYLQNIRTGVRGWVRDDLLRDDGSFRFCGF